MLQKKFEVWQNKTLTHKDEIMKKLNLTTDAEFGAWFDGKKTAWLERAEKGDKKKFGGDKKGGKKGSRKDGSRKDKSGGEKDGSWKEKKPELEDGLPDRIGLSGGSLKHGNNDRKPEFGEEGPEDEIVRAGPVWEDEEDEHDLHDWVDVHLDLEDEDHKDDTDLDDLDLFFDERSDSFAEDEGDLLEKIEGGDEIDGDRKAAWGDKKERWAAESSHEKKPFDKWSSDKKADLKNGVVDNEDDAANAKKDRALKKFFMILRREHKMWEKLELEWAKFNGFDFGRPLHDEDIKHDEEHDGEEHDEEVLLRAAKQFRGSKSAGSYAYDARNAAGAKKDETKASGIYGKNMASKEKSSSNAYSGKKSAYAGAGKKSTDRAKPSMRGEMRGEKPARSEKPVRGEKPVRSEKPMPGNEKPARGDRGASWEKPAFGDEKPARSEKPSTDRPFFGEKPATDDKRPASDEKKSARGETAHGDFQKPEKPMRGEKPMGGEKPIRGQKPIGGEKPMRDNMPMGWPYDKMPTRGDKPMGEEVKSSYGEKPNAARGDQAEFSADKDRISSALRDRKAGSDKTSGMVDRDEKFPGGKKPPLHKPCERGVAQDRSGESWEKPCEEKVLPKIQHLPVPHRFHIPQVVRLALTLTKLISKKIEDPKALQPGQRLRRAVVWRIKGFFHVMKKLAKKLCSRPSPCDETTRPCVRPLPFDKENKMPEGVGRNHCSFGTARTVIARVIYYQNSVDVSSIAIRTRSSSKNQ